MILRQLTHYGSGRIYLGRKNIPQNNEITHRAVITGSAYGLKSTLRTKFDEMRSISQR